MGFLRSALTTSLVLTSNAVALDPIVMKVSRAGPPIRTGKHAFFLLFLSLFDHRADMITTGIEVLHQEW